MSAINTRRTLRKELFTALASVLSAIVFIGCASHSPPPEVAPYAKLLESAAAYIGGLREQDKLPGFHKGEHGSLTSIPEPVWDKGVTYPVSVVLRGAKEGSHSFYSYTLLKRDSEAKWQLVEATRWDKSGHISEQLLPK